MQLTDTFKKQVVDALLTYRKNFDGPDTRFAKKFGINPAIFSRLKNADSYDKLISPAQWINIGAELNVRPEKRQWKVVRTEVFMHIEEEVLFCKAYGKSMVFADECEIGKTFTLTYLSRTLPNCFYVDASQCKTKTLFVRELARVLGLDVNGRIADIKKKIKYSLNCIKNPVVLIDEWADLEQAAKLEWKEMWNATSGNVGWYITGAESLIALFELGIANNKQGYAENWSRLGSNYSQIVPKSSKEEKIEFYKKLLTDVVSANVDSPALVKKIVRQCLTPAAGFKIGGLRRLATLIDLNNNGDHNGEKYDN